MVHGIAKLQARHLLCQEVLNVSGISNLYIVGCDKASYHRCIFQSLRSASGGNDNLVEGCGIWLQTQHMAILALAVGLQNESLGLKTNIANLHSHSIGIGIRHTKVAILVGSNSAIAMHQLHGCSC